MRNAYNKNRRKETTKEIELTHQESIWPFHQISGNIIEAGIVKWMEMK